MNIKANVFLGIILTYSFTAHATPNEPYPIDNQIVAPTTQVGVANLCPSTVWFQYTGPESVGVIPHLVKVEPLQQYNYNVTSDMRSVSFRLTPKLYCNNVGESCAIGDDSAPAINTLFEASFTPPDDNNPIAATYDISLVDGATIPAIVKVFQGENEIDGNCTDIDDGRLPYPPITLDSTQSDYQNKIVYYSDFCKSASLLDNSDNSFFTNTVSDNSDYYMQWFTIPVANDTTDLAKLTPQIRNPNRILANGGNSASDLIACASPSGRLLSILPSQSSYPADNQGLFHPENYQQTQGGSTNYSQSLKYDADVLMINCPFASLDVSNQISGGTVDYTSNYDLTNGVSADDNPFYQLIQRFLNYPNFGPISTTGGTVYNAGIMCKFGPATNTYWTNLIHRKTTFTYAYPYDDNIGTRSCRSSNSKVVFVACGQEN